jgi:hypothetical protein
LYGTTIANSLELSRAMGTEPRRDVYTRQFPQAFATRVLVQTSVRDNSQRVAGPFMIVSEGNLSGRFFARPIHVPSK